MTGAVAHPFFALVTCAVVGEVRAAFYGAVVDQVARIDGREIATLTADADTAVTTVGAETAWLMAGVVPGLEQDYPSLIVSAGGEQAEAGRFGSSLACSFALATCVIYALLSLAFGSYLRPLIVLGVIPFGVIANDRLLILEPSVQAQFLIPPAISLGFGVLFVAVMQMILVPVYASLFARGRRRMTGRDTTQGASVALLLENTVLRSVQHHDQLEQLHLSAERQLRATVPAGDAEDVVPT